MDTGEKFLFFLRKSGFELNGQVLTKPLEQHGQNFAQLRLHLD